MPKNNAGRMEEQLDRRDRRAPNSRSFSDRPAKTVNAADDTPNVNRPPLRPPSATPRKFLFRSATELDSQPTTPLSEDNLRRLEALHKSRPSAQSYPSAAYMRKKTSPKKADKKKSKEEKDTHPLNLPPDELRRLSAAMAQNEGAWSPMDVDNEPVTSPTESSQPTTPFHTAPGAFPESTNGTTNGVNGHEEYDEDKSPTPPPHVVPPEPKIDPEACKAAGNKFFKAKDYNRAVVEYTKAVNAEPLNPIYLSNRSAGYMGANRFSAALSDSVQANKLDPGNDKNLLRLARIYTSLGRPQDALDTFAKLAGGASAKDTALAKTALDAITSAEKTIEDENGSGTMALWNLDRAKQTLGVGVPWPRRWQILRARANLKVGSTNSLGEVQGIATSLTRDNPTDAEAIMLAGRALYLKGEPKANARAKSDYERAEDCFKQALALDPDMTEAARCLRLMRKMDKAKEEANSLFKAKRYSEAVKLYTDALQVDPAGKITKAKLLGNRAMARIRIKEYDEAMADCDQALKLDPSYTKAKRTRAKAVGESGNWQQAVTDLKEMLEQDQGNADLQKEVRNAEMELKKSRRKDYYKILGVEKDADENQIKRAYKKRALTCHPDKHPGNKQKEEEFKDLTEANETLMDAEKRQRYDSGVDLMDPSEMFGHGHGGGGMPQGFGGGGMGGMGGMQIDPEMLFNMMNGGMGGGGGARGGGGMPQFSFGQGGGRGGFPFG